MESADKDTTENASRSKDLVNLHNLQQDVLFFAKLGEHHLDKYSVLSKRINTID